MKFTTPCFVRVEDAEERKQLIKWLENIGYLFNNRYKDAYEVAISPTNVTKVILAETRACTGFIDALMTAPEWGIDCGTNVELFKALAAMNDENAYMQYFVYRPKGYLSQILGGWWLCTEQRWIDWAKPRFCNSMVFARKATAEELINHFKD